MHGGGIKNKAVSNLPAWARLHGGSLLKESDLGVIKKVSLHIKIHVQETFLKSVLSFFALQCNTVLENTMMTWEGFPKVLAQNAALNLHI